MDPKTGSSDIFPRDPLVPRGFGVHFLSNIASLIDNSKYLYVPGSLTLQETFNFVSKFAGALIVWLSSGSNSNLAQVVSRGQKFSGVLFDQLSKGKPGIPFILGTLSRFSMKQFCKDVGHLQSLPLLSLAAAPVPPFENV